ncbi:extracellular solute-binding protein [Acrocarpospora catenulata]|uniref:extracellular solute-binding protein n=1 Tax=Acrocarpospora catenulata TaxID=2836182 RepID=UPI0027E0F5E0|nr:extracellular solute-binding protein [Acrocarpospora catenulata]
MLSVAAAALFLAGCGSSGSETPQGGGGSGAAQEKVTIEWWHIQNIEPMKPVWDQLAKDYMAAHPNVTINITALENEAFKAKMTTVAQSGESPDIYQTWGGGVLKQQADAGIAKDITADVASWIDTITPAASAAYKLDGKVYGIPYDIGMVGFWYNKALFAKAGIEGTPATWGEFIDDVKKLKAAGITPLSLAGKAKWPGHYYWAYLAMRIGGLPALKEASVSKSFENPDFIAAGQKLKELSDLQPFQKGFLGAPYDTPEGQAATMGNAKAAMELMGQWAPNVQRDTSKDLGDDLGFFPFPSVEGGKGAGTDAFGGGGGFAVGGDAPPEAVDFLKFITSADSVRKTVGTGVILPVVKGVEDAVTDPRGKMVADSLAQATDFQLYLDQAYPPAVGAQVNDSVAELIAGTKSPEEVVKAITEVAQSE